jgi:hypothetical protein
VVSMWILTFTRWGQYYLCGRDMTDREPDELSRSACELAMVRPMNEWRSKSATDLDKLLKTEPINRGELFGPFPRVLEEPGAAPRQTPVRFFWRRCARH